MVDVEQDALCALEEDAASTAGSLVEVAPDGSRELQHEIGNLGEVVAKSLTIDRRLSKTGPKRVMMRAEAVEERVQFTQVG